MKAILNNNVTLSVTPNLIPPHLHFLKFRINMQIFQSTKSLIIE